MPPRYAYWTILIDNKPTAFRSRDEEELLPTLNQLRRKNSDVVMKWFARGRLWDTPEQAHWAGKNLEGSAERRGKGWRPGGEHKDPRARLDKRKHEKPGAAAHSVRPADKKAFRPAESQEQDRPWRDKKPGGAQGQRPGQHTGPKGERPGRDNPAPGAARSGPPWQRRKPPSGAGKRPWAGKPPSGAGRSERSWRGKPPSGDAKSGPPWRREPPSGAGAGRHPWTGKPPSNAGAGRPPWAGKPPSSGGEGWRPWRDKPGPGAAKGGRPGREPRAGDHPAPGAAQGHPGRSAPSSGAGGDGLPALPATTPGVRSPGAGDTSAGLAHRPGAQESPKLQKGEERPIEPKRIIDPADRG